MSPDRAGDIALAIAAFALAALVRLSPVLHEEPVGRDQIEYENIAANLAAGRGFTLDIKAYHAHATGVRHYAGRDRAPLLPVSLAALGTVLPPERASRILGPVCFLLALAFVFDLVRRLAGTRAAAWSVLIAGVHPGLVEVSLRPLTEAPGAALLAGQLWAVLGIASPAAAGVFGALAFLNRPESALVSALLFPALIRRARARGTGRGAWVYPAVTLLGPLALIAANLRHGEPPLLLPQSHLFRVFSYQDGLHYFHREEIAATAPEFLSVHGFRAGVGALRNGFYYLVAMADWRIGPGMALILIPAAWRGIRGEPRARTLGWLALAAGADLGFRTLCWATFDAERFTANAVFLGLVLIASGVSLADRRLGDQLPGADLARLLARTLAALSLLWLTADVYRSWVAMREYETGSPMRNNMESLWTGTDVREAEALLRAFAADAGAGGEPPVILSNEPWLAHRLSGLPSVLVPWDVTAEDFDALMSDYRPSLLMIHEGDWPLSERAGLARLLECAADAGGSELLRAGRITVLSLRPTPDSETTTED